MTPNLDIVLDQITQAFRPAPITCQINGQTFYIERIAAGWFWRNEDGDTQEDFGIAPFGTAAEAQNSAIRYVRLELLRHRRNALFEESMVFENDPANLKDGKKWHDGVQQYAEQIRKLDYQIKLAGTI